jgi:outer membrane protein assembly factor BamB
MSSSENQPATADVSALIFVGFNSRIAALDRASGEVVWSWKSPQGTGIPMLLLDGDRLIVSVQGYTYSLDPQNGAELWRNPLKGMGLGTPCLASARGGSTTQLYAVLAEYELQQQQAANAAAHSSTAT